MLQNALDNVSNRVGAAAGVQDATTSQLDPFRWATRHVPGSGPALLRMCLAHDVMSAHRCGLPAAVAPRGP